MIDSHCLMKSFGFNVEENHDSPRGNSVRRPSYAFQLQPMSYMCLIGRRIVTIIVPVSKPHVITKSRTGPRNPSFTLRTNEGEIFAWTCLDVLD